MRLLLLLSLILTLLLSSVSLGECVPVSSHCMNNMCLMTYSYYVTSRSLVSNHFHITYSLLQYELPLLTPAGGG